MRYLSDLTDSQWEMICGFFPVGNKSKWDKRELVNAVLYVVKSGCQWRMLPKEFPPYQTVYAFFRRAKLNGTWHKALRSLVGTTRVINGRSMNPSYALIDSQSVKTVYASDERGYDGGKKRKAASVIS
jgi:putative transposase